MKEDEPFPEIITKEQVRRGIKAVVKDIPISRGYVAVLHNWTNEIASSTLIGTVIRSKIVFDARNKSLRDIGYRERKRLDETTFETMFTPELSESEEADAQRFVEFVEGVVRERGIAKMYEIMMRSFEIMQEEAEAEVEEKPKKKPKKR